MEQTLHCEEQVKNDRGCPTKWQGDSLVLYGEVSNITPSTTLCVSVSNGLFPLHLHGVDIALQSVDVVPSFQTIHRDDDQLRVSLIVD
ncbi:hypothetical protein J6590_021497 [Homalodisca vitripennis]|nr:hypothetical protein J6590_021497 [Homalodisca vitripennis]